MLVLYLIITGKPCIVQLRPLYDRNRQFFLISIVIDSDRRHCCQHFKKNQFKMKIEPVTCIWMFVCAMNFWAARNGKNFNFWLFRTNLCELGLFHLYFVCKCSSREISMIKKFFLNQSKSISLILKIKLKIQKSEIYKLHVYYS